ncbi:TPA: hypothetical protein MYL57_002543 [Klebsiella variicola subsp. variicola]|uniref:hypothetical protein n=1 Tax=Klebsiella variicola TaxID=244366 RepID=UPI00190E907B|nr:hypothetical protein [Klebsiella variicola]HCB0642565.1 hypothetical protein [Klebsiella variicola subsp. variicola]
MEKSSKNERFGDFSQYERARKDLYEVCEKILAFPREREHERYFLLAVIRRTLSLETAFRQSVDACNGQMAMTLVRLNLDTLARFYALYWADETDGMTAETFAKEVAQGKSIKDMKFRGAKEKASDRWLIKQIESLGDWIPIVYKKTSGAIHFSDFHIKQLLQQAKPIRRLEDGSLHAELSIGPGEQNAEPELYRELQQSFLHISLMLIVGVQHRCEPALD